MKDFKISIHCGQVNTFQFEQWLTKEDAQAHYHELLANPPHALYLKFGDVLVNPALITFVVVEEVITKAVEEPATTLEA